MSTPATRLLAAAQALAAELAPLHPWGPTVVRLDLEWRLAHTLVAAGMTPAEAAEASQALSAAAPSEAAALEALTEALLQLQVAAAEPV